MLRNMLGLVQYLVYGLNSLKKFRGHNLTFSHLADDSTVQEKFDFVGIDKLNFSLNRGNALSIANYDVDFRVGERRGVDVGVVKVDVENLPAADGVVDGFVDF